MATPLIPMEMRLDNDALGYVGYDQTAIFRGPDSILAQVICAPSSTEAARILIPSVGSEDDYNGGWMRRAVATATITGALAAPAVDVFSTPSAAAQGIEVEIPLNTAEASLPPKSVVIFDDSIGVGRRDYGGEEQKLEAAGVDVTVFDAVGGRQTAWEMCDTSPTGPGCSKFPDVLVAMERYQPEIAKATAVVIRTGTNDDMELEEDLMRVSRQAVAYGTADGSEPPLVVLANTFGTSPYVKSDEKNPIYPRVVDRLKSEGIEAALIDYRTFVDTVMRPAGGMSRDEVHPNASTGYPLMADYDAQVIPPLINAYHNKLYPPKAVDPEVVIPPVVIPPAEPAAPPVTPEPQPEIPVVEVPVVPVQPPEEKGQDDYLGMSRGLLYVDRNSLETAFSASEIISNVPVAVPVVRSLARPRPVEPAAVEDTVVNVSPAEVTPERIVANVPEVDTTTEVPVAELVPVAESRDLPLEPELSPPRPVQPPVETPPDSGQPASPPDTVAPPEPAPSTGELSREEVVALAATHGLFYDEQGRARQQLHDFVDRQEMPDLVITEGFGDFRRINGRSWKQGNKDASTESSTIGRRDVHLVNPAPGIYHEVYTEGEGLKVFIEYGISERTGKPWFFYNTHMSESVGVEGEIVDLGTVLGRAGMTGLVETEHPIFSVGLTDQFTLEEMQEYANSSEAVNLHDYSVPGLQFSCRSSALDDPGKEFCGPTQPGVSYSLPAHPRVLEKYGLPANLPPVEAVPEPEPEPEPSEPAREEPEPADVGVIVDVDVGGLKEIDDLVPEVDESEEVEIVEPDDEEPEEPSIEPPVVTVEDQPDEDSMGGDDEGGASAPPADNDGQEGEEPDTEEPVDTPAEEPAEPTPEPPAEEPAPEEPAPPPEEAPVPPAPEAPMSDIFTNEVIQAILPEAPMENIAAYTPLILNALGEFGIADPQMGCYDFATIRPETSGFAPIPEISRGRGHDYGVQDPETGHTYYGRGFIQLTWRSNYQKYGDILGIDLVHNPDLALDPTIAARVMALYLKDHEGGIRETLNNGDLRGARQIVNGKAAHGLERFSEAYRVCAAAVGI